MIPGWVILVYALIGGLLLVVSAILTVFESGKVQRNAARLVLISPIWPVLPILGLALTLRALWRTADLTNKR